VDCSITVKLNTGICRTIAGIAETDWASIDCTDGGEA
jgi:hypothetical protein